ncbi:MULTISPECIES: hypothetical protein [unclassified Nocardia]|uniref:hypothetical protein n=1 Tax=unclassified Nocardia TaxID=2637762 RepID=UPI001CE4092D|nr:MULTISPECIES: hypothetical protein [unclassified Nocardia]
MRIRIAVAGLGIAAAGAAIATGIGAGNAAAFTPVIATDKMTVGVLLDHNETVALNNSPIVGMLDDPITNGGVFYIDRASVYHHEGVVIDGVTYTDDISFAGVVDEAAAAPNGHIGIGLTDPAENDGANYAVTQSLR